MKVKKKDSSQTQVKWRIRKYKYFINKLDPLQEEDRVERKYLTRKKFLGEKTMIKNFLIQKRC